MDSENWKLLADEISERTSKSFAIKNIKAVSVGCINTTFKVESESDSYFVKTNSSEKLEMFEAELDGLSELEAVNVICVPKSICTGVLDNESYIVLDYIDLNGKPDMQMLGHQLALLHSHESPSLEFGWNRDNTIGATNQINTQTTDWQKFWHEQRLGYQLNLAKQNGANKDLLDKGERIQADLRIFFKGYEPKPSLLHGDLWSGNVGFAEGGHPVIFDPAIYYGDREADLAMTELFGGFSDGFYRAYEDVSPLDEGYSVRKKLYNLYHILNHFNLFGGSYGDQADRICSLILRNL